MPVTRCPGEPVSEASRAGSGPDCVSAGGRDMIGTTPGAACGLKHLCENLRCHLLQIKGDSTVPDALLNLQFLTLHTSEGHVYSGDIAA